MSEHGPVSDVESIYDDQDTSSGKSAIRIASVAALGGFLFGYDSAVINGAVSAVEDHFAVSSESLGFAVASALLGAAAGGIRQGVAQEVGADMPLLAHERRHGQEGDVDQKDLDRRGARRHR